MNYVFKIVVSDKNKVYEFFSSVSIDGIGMTESTFLRVPAFGSMTKKMLVFIPATQSPHKQRGEMSPGKSMPLTVQRRTEQLFSSPAINFT